MNIFIPDNIVPSKRKEILNIYPVIYAIEKHKGNLVEAAKFLDLSRRALLDRLNKYQLLQVFRGKNRFEIDGITREELEKKNKDPLRKLYAYHLHRSTKSFWWNTCSEKDKTDFLKRLAELYSIVVPKK